MGEGRDTTCAASVGDLRRTDVPVIAGAEFPLLNSKEESERWEAMYGKFEYKGAWTDSFEAQRSTVYEMPYHAPDIVPRCRKESRISKRRKVLRPSSSSRWCTSTRVRSFFGRGDRLRTMPWPSNSTRRWQRWRKSLFSWAADCTQTKAPLTPARSMPAANLIGGSIQKRPTLCYGRLGRR